MYGSPYQPYGAPICGAQISTTSNFIPSNSLVMGNNACYQGPPQIMSAGMQSFPPIVAGGYSGGMTNRALIPPVYGTSPAYGMTPGFAGPGVYQNQCCFGCDPTCGICTCLGCTLCCCGPTGCFNQGCCGPMCFGGVGDIGGIGSGCCGAGCPGCFGCGCGPAGGCFGPVGYGFGCCPICC